jgi:hypothetical protein
MDAVRHLPDKGQRRVAFPGQHSLDRAPASTRQLGKPCCVDAPRSTGSTQIPAKDLTGIVAPPAL